MTTEIKTKFHSSHILYVVSATTFIAGIIYLDQTFLTSEDTMAPHLFSIILYLYLTIGSITIGIGTALTQKKVSYLSYEECLKRGHQHHRRELKKEMKNSKTFSMPIAAVAYFFYGILAYCLYLAYLDWKNSKKADPEMASETSKWIDGFFVYCAWIMNKESRIGFSAFILGFLVIFLSSLTGEALDFLPLLGGVIFIFAGYKILRGILEVV